MMEGCKRWLNFGCARQPTISASYFHKYNPALIEESLAHIPSGERTKVMTSAGKTGTAQASILLAFWIVLSAQPNVIAQSLRFRPLGHPTANKVEAARKINELMFVEQRLYVGHGDWFKNTGPTDVIYYDFDKQEFVTEYTVDEEAIHRYRHYGSRLFLPGTDSTENGEYGNLYVRDASTWKKYRTIPRGLHVFDFAEFKGKWYVATGSYFGDIKTGPWIGAIYSSEDQATSWRYEYTTASAGRSVSRITSLMPYKNRLFAFGYTDGPMPRGSEPKLFPAGEDRQSNRVATSVVYDGDGWFSADLIPDTKLIQTIEPAVFADQLLLNVRVGRYGPDIPNEWQLFAHDGKSTRRVPLASDPIIDMLVKHDRLILLLEQQGKHVLSESSELVHWTNHVIDPEVKQPLSVEFDGTSYYLGLSDGTVLTATVPAD